MLKKVFVLGLTVLSSSITGALNCVSMNNQQSKVGHKIVDINSNNPISYPFSIKINKCSGNCNNINNTYAKICVSDVKKDLNVKVFNPMSKTNETKFIKWHEKCKCECGLNAIICNNKQGWNENKCRCECKKLIDKRIYDKGFICNPSNCECECDKNCVFSEYLDYENCRKKLVDKLIDECTKTVEEVKLANITFTINENSYYKCSSCKVYIILMIVICTVFTEITIYFVYYNWSLIKNNVFCIKFNTSKETKI